MENLMLLQEQLISPWLSGLGRTIAGNDRVLDVYLHSTAGSVQVGGGGLPQTITSQALPSSWRGVMVNTLSRLSQAIDLRFRLVERPEQAELALYVDREINLGDPSGITFGLTLSNSERATGRSWWEIFLNGPQLQRSNADFVDYVIVHEMAHILGLEHPFDNSDGDFYLSTNPQLSAFPHQTVMAYRQPEGGTWPGWYSATDLAALQQVWGAAPGPDQLTSIYRLYNPGTGFHLFSANRGEIDQVTGQGFVNEGVAYRTSAVASQGLHRFYQLASGRHFYSASDGERDALLANSASGYLYEGVAYQVYAATAAPLNTSPVVRFYDPATATHFYTASPAEQQILQTTQPGWRMEGVAWYA